MSECGWLQVRGPCHSSGEIREGGKLYLAVLFIDIQDNYGQGSLMGGKCEWDVNTDDFVRAALDLEKISLVVVVFFLAIDDSCESEAD